MVAVRIIFSNSFACCFSRFSVLPIDQVQLVPYYKDDDRVDISMLWTELPEDHGDGFHQIAALKNTYEALDGLRGNCQEGTIVGIDPTHYSYLGTVNKNQLWKIVDKGTARRLTKELGLGGARLKKLAPISLRN